jgi:hypothetical protein
VGKILARHGYTEPGLGVSTENTLGASQADVPHPLHGKHSIPLQDMTG